MAAVVRVEATLDLDRSVQRIRQLLSTHDSTPWKVGVELGIIHRGGLWRQRQRADGDLAYRSFARFCKAELGLTHGTVFGLIDVAAAFDEEDVKKYGTSKLVYLLRTPVPARERIKKMIEDGASQREIKEALKIEKERYGVIAKRETGRTLVGSRVQSRSWLKKRPIEKSLRPLSNVKLRFVTRATIGKRATKSAKNLSEKPVIDMRLNDQVMMRVAIGKDPDGSIVGSISLRRVIDR